MMAETVVMVIIGGVAIIARVVSSIKVGRKDIMVIETPDGDRHNAERDRSQSGAVRIKR